MKLSIWAVVALLALPAPSEAEEHAPPKVTGENTAAAAATDSDEKRYGWHFAGLPLVNFNSDEGVGYGARVAAYDHGDDHKPYRYAIVGQFFQTTKDLMAHRISFDAPRLFASTWRVGGEVQLYAERFSNYFGLGNNSVRDSSFVECNSAAALEDNPDLCPGNPEFKGKRYYQYSETVPALVLNVRKDITDRWQLFLGYRFRYYDLDVAYSRDDLGQSGPSKLVEDYNSGRDIIGLEFDSGGHPVAQRDGETRLGVVYDTRDNEPAPSSGVWNELSLRAAGKHAGGNYGYGGATAIFRGYYQIVPRLVLAGRVLGDFMVGNVPFYQLSLTGGIFDVEGLGGGRTLRGLLKQRYIGKIKATSSAELRYKFAKTKIFEQDIHFTVMAGADMGRVWRDYSADGNGLGLSAGAVAGLYIAWNTNFVVRADYARALTDETTGVYIGFNHLF